MKNKGYVYLLSENGSQNFKIGMTKKENIEDRIKELQTGNSLEIRLIAYYPTNRPYKLESMLHNRYKLLRENGEWFNFEGMDAKKEFMTSCDFYQHIINSLEDNPFF